MIRLVNSGNEQGTIEVTDSISFDFASWMVVDTGGGTDASTADSLIVQDLLVEPDSVAEIIVEAVIADVPSGTRIQNTACWSQPPEGGAPGCVTAPPIPVVAEPGCEQVGTPSVTPDTACTEQLVTLDGSTVDLPTCAGGARTPVVPRGRSHRHERDDPRHAERDHALPSPRHVLGRSRLHVDHDADRDDHAAAGARGGHRARRRDCNLGLEISWTDAVFESGSGTYHVYRSTVSCDDALARPALQSVTRTRWVDTSTENGVEYHYVVEAEDSAADAPCEPAGPNNGGLVTRLCVGPATEVGDSVERPEDVGNFLRARRDGDLVELRWDLGPPATGGAHYHVTATDFDPQETFILLNIEGQTSALHRDATDSALRFYDVPWRTPASKSRTTDVARRAPAWTQTTPRAPSSSTSGHVVLDLVPPMSSSPFSQLSADDLGAIAEHGISRSFAKNVIVVQEGDDSDSFYMIRNGRVKIFLSQSDGKEVTLGTQGPGEFFGELALLDESPRSASVITLEPCELTVVSGADFRRCLAEDLELAGRLIRLLSKRVRELTESVKVLALLDVYGRVRACLLARTIERDGELEVAESLTHQEIANRIGASREAVSNVIGELRNGGYLETSRQSIRILKPLPEAVLSEKRAS